MGKNARPSLSAIMGANQPSAPANRSAAHAPTPAPKRRSVGRRRQGYEQLNVLVPSGLRQAARIKAMQANRDLSDVVSEFLQGWVSS